MTPSSAPARTVLVLGANGRFGLAAAQAFAAAGWRVLAHVRRDAAAGMPAGAELVRAPLAAVADALRGRPVPDVVVHGINPIYTRWDEEALPAARAAMDLAERFGARFMLPGNVYNHGESMPGRIDETTPRHSGWRRHAAGVAAACRGRCCASSASSCRSGASWRGCPTSGVCRTHSTARSSPGAAPD